MRTSTKFLIAFVLSAGVLLLSATAGLLLAVAADLGVAAQWPATASALRVGFTVAGLLSGGAAMFTGGLAAMEAD